MLKSRFVTTGLTVLSFTEATNLVLSQLKRCTLLERSDILRRCEIFTVICLSRASQGVCTEAGMYALRERRVHVTQEDFELAVAKVWIYCEF